MSERTETEVASWVASLGHRVDRVQSLAGDVSHRRYFRVTTPDGRRVVAVYPPALRETCERFVATTELLAASGIRVPAVERVDPERGFALLEDAGPETLYERYGPRSDRLGPALELAVAVLGRIRALPRERVARLSPPLDGPALRAELEPAFDLVLGPEGLGGERELATRFRTACDDLCAALGESELVPSHRDFMLRNLVPRGGDPPTELVVLDHQDLRLAPPGYDLASLLNDSCFPGPELEEPLVARLTPGESGRLGYRRAVVQRCLKAAGTFAAFAARGHERHLPLVRPTLGRAWRQWPAIPELAPLVAPLAGAWSRWLAIC